MNGSRRSLVPPALASAIAATTLALAQTAAPPPAPSEKSVSNENRLLQRTIEDGAVTEGFRVDVSFRFQSFSRRSPLDSIYQDVPAFRRNDTLSLVPTFSATIAEDVELGGRIGLTSLNPAPGGLETGLTDLDVYGKVRLTTKPTQVAIGALIKLPTGSESASLGTGETDVAFFAGLRHDWSGASLVANAGFRINQDPDYTVDPNLPDLEGETSIQLGAAVLVPFNAKWVGQAEATFETERIDRTGSDLRLTLGAEYRANETIMWRGGIGAGAGDGAPNYEVIVGGVFLF